ncbi:low molecular weight protein arginine phosphatase [Pseudalkalibacillus caeni]|uniref:Low molecular weight protein arginine phosphatase n=1 Tax=Exobacillus caeni TaxID=2574798 RepID=A0A5R9F142_9BACL|nr:low molecular weight protein arginine phosphatase [Pseudalkalibacillus caeni]TLS36721.1 low molecular weight protein arginine phosphatase [Pseudalkalibacillus caeni]
MKVLFICTGNTCRSPMAEALLRHKSNGKLEVKSAGVFAQNGSSASQQTIQVLSENSIACQHRSRPLDRSLVDWADLLLTMTENHKAILLRDYPEAAFKIFTLKEYALNQSKSERAYQEFHEKYAELETKRAGFLYELDKKNLSHAEREEEIEAFQKKTRPELVELLQLEKNLPDLDVSDPFGGHVEVYRETYEELDQLIDELIKKFEKK